MATISQLKNRIMQMALEDLMERDSNYGTMQIVTGRVQLTENDVSRFYRALHELDRTIHNRSVGLGFRDDTMDFRVAHTEIPGERCMESGQEEYYKANRRGA